MRTRGKGWRLQRRLRLRLVVLLVVAVALGHAAPAAAASRAAGAGRPATGAVVPAGVVVSPDPAHDLYVGTGGLIVPSRDWRSGGGRSEAAGCPDCQWRISLLCTKGDFAAGLCVRIDLGCAVGKQPVRVWLLHPGGSWTVVGQACQGGAPPRTVEDVGRAVRDRAQAALPPLLPGAQPQTGALVRVPVAFRTGQPASGIRHADLSVLGLDVRLDAVARWHWSWGDGAATWTSSPGGRYPDLSVSHVYLRAGVVTAGVAAVWRGSYVVDGLGPFAVPGDPLVQTGSVRVVVRGAHAVLVG